LSGVDGGSDSAGYVGQSDGGWGVADDDSTVGSSACEGSACWGWEFVDGGSDIADEGLDFSDDGPDLAARGSDLAAGGSGFVVADPDLAAGG